MTRLHPHTTEQLLPSGRSVVVRLADQGEELLVRSPEGEVEVRILLTEGGPVVRLRAARLELESSERIDVACRQFNVEAEEVRVRTQGDIHMNGATIRLNS